MFKQFRDSLTGMFTTKADAKARPAQTEAEEPSRIIEAKVILRKALRDEQRFTSHYDRNLTLHNAIDKVLKL